MFLDFGYATAAKKEQSEVAFEYGYQMPQSLTFDTEYSADVGTLSVTNIGRQNTKFYYSKHTPRVYLYNKITKECDYNNHLILFRWEEMFSFTFAILNSSLYYHLMPPNQTRVFSASIHLRDDSHFYEWVSFITLNYKNLEYHFFNPANFVGVDEKGCPLKTPDFKIVNIRIPD